VDSSFRGTGWDFPVGVTEDGTIRVTGDGEECVRNSIWTILSTSPGERVMRPDFGCGIGDHVFDLSGPATAGTIADTVRDALLEWEPRIEVLDVEAAPDPKDPARLLVAIEYRLRSSNGRLNLVYPFYLE